MKNMMTFSLKTKLSLLAIIISFTFTGQAKAQLQQVASTPYDRQMTPVRYLLEQKSDSNQGVSMYELNSMMRDLRSIPYQYSTNWKTPQQVQTEYKADCKAKAIALYSILKQRGVNNLRLVIGLRTKSSKLTHAWLEMNHDGKTYLLDPTYYNRVRTVGSDRRDYLQNFAYEGANKYRI